MKLGSRLFELSRRRVAVGLSLLAAVIACLLTLYRPTLSPLGLHARDLQIGAASTEVLVAAPNVVIGGSGADYAALVNRSILVGNVMVSEPVLDYVGHALGIDPRRIAGTAPMTANVPRALIDPGGGGNATDIIASPDHYKLEIQADPSVPILHVYTQAPSGAAAIRFATAAVQGLTIYLHQTETAGAIPPKQQVRIEQLGRAEGGVANPGGGKEIVILVFFGVFGVALWVMTIAGRIGQGWSAARLAGQEMP